MPNPLEAQLSVGDHVRMRRNPTQRGVWLVAEVLKDPPGYLVRKGRRELEVAAAQVTQTTDPLAAENPPKKARLIAPEQMLEVPPHSFVRGDLGDFCMQWIESEGL